MVPLLSAGLLVIFGSITLISGDVTYIKMKPTFINLLFAVTLTGGALMKKGLLKHIMGSNLVLPEKIWIIFSIRWAIFFCLLAGLNEYVWRHFPEETWVKFKVFGLLSLTIAFTLSQIPFISKHRIIES
jgi:intracellular septation protein